MSKFVIYTPDHNDYFVGQTGPGTGWDFDIEKAQFYRIFAQAERAAKVIAAQMPNHDAPYRLFIREVKEKNGQWKVKGEIEVRADPDRIEYYRENPGDKARIISPSEAPAASPDYPVTYVIYQAAKDDYLATIEEKGKLRQTMWAPHPRDAMTFKTAKAAKAEAKALVEAHGYELTTCKLHRNETQCWTEPMEDIFPIDPSLN